MLIIIILRSIENVLDCLSQTEVLDVGLRDTLLSLLPFPRVGEPRCDSEGTSSLDYQLERQ